MATILSSILTGTPGSDIAVGQHTGEIVWGRSGNNVVLGYQPIGVNASNAQSDIDILLGDSELSQLTSISTVPHTFQEKFILGDWNTPYYANGNPLSLGLNNFAVLGDFNPTQDTIQLYGQASNYQLYNVLGLVTVLAYNQPIFPTVPSLSFLTSPDVIAIIPTAGLNLNASYFKYVGNTPPPVVNSNIKQFGTVGFELANSLTVDNSGNVYVAGDTTGSLNVPNIGLRDIFFDKYDSSGNLIYSKQFGTTGATDSVGSIVTDSQGNLYMVGYSNGDISGPLLGVNTDAFIAKFDSQGNKLWLEKIIGSGNGQPSTSYGIQIDPYGNIDVAGVVDVPTPAGSTFPLQTDNFATQYDANGNQKWFVQQGNSGVNDYDEAYNLSVDNQGNTYRGSFTTGDFGGTSLGLYDAWIAKTDKNGTSQWIAKVATPDYDWIWSLANDSKDNVLATGWTLGSFTNTLNGNSNLGSYDAFLTKYDTNGNRLWLKQFGTSGDDEAFTVKVDRSDNIYVAGYTNGAFAGFTNQGGFDAFVIKFDTNGNQKWVQEFGTSGTDQAYNLAIGPNNTLYVTGTTDGSLGSPNQGSFDSWVAKLDANNGSLESFTGNNSTNQRSTPLASASQLITNAPTQTSSSNQPNQSSIYNQLISNSSLISNLTGTVLKPSVTEIKAPTQTFSITENKPYDIAVADILANDTGNGPLSLTAVSNPINGTVTLKNGTVTFTPRAGYLGDNASFNYTLSDRQGGITNALVNVSVNSFQGTSSKDTLVGTQYNDTFIGTPGRDILTGLGGKNTYVYNSVTDTGNTITDFKPGTDKIVLTNLLQVIKYVGSDPIADGYIKFTSTKTGSIIQVDPDGSLGSAPARNFLMLDNVSAAQINNPNNFVF